MRYEDMNESEKRFVDAFNKHIAEVRAMTVEELNEHRRQLVQLRQDAMAEIAAIDKERQRRKESSGTE